MQQTDKLALRIYKGTRILGLDEYPLVAVGTVPHSFQPRTPSLVNEPEVWMLMHAQDYTLYSYIVTNDDLDCIILISLFVPADMRLTADDSPHDLLSKAFESFKTQCNQSSIDTMPFEQLLARCVLEERPDEIHLPVMGGINPASFCADSKAQVNALLRFSHYQQLSNISRLEISYQCDTTITIPIKAGQKPKPLQEHKTIDQHKEPTRNQSLKQDSNIDIDTKPKKKYYQKGYFYFFIVVAIFVVAFFCKGIWSDAEQARLRADSIAAAKKAQEEAAKKAQEEEPAKEATKAEILKLVNNKDLSACRNHLGWHTQLTKKERLAVEAVLNMDQYNDVVLEKKIEKELRGKTFNSWTELLDMRDRIISIHKGK